MNGLSQSTSEEIDMLNLPFDKGSVPKELRGLFLLVRDVEHIRSKGFAGYRDGEESSTKRRSNTARAYDRKLSRKAEILSGACTDRKMATSGEEHWIWVLMRVFYRFNREEEEMARTHHW